MALRRWLELMRNSHCNGQQRVCGRQEGVGDGLMAAYGKAAADVGAATGLMAAANEAKAKADAAHTDGC